MASRTRLLLVATVLAYVFTGCLNTTIPPLGDSDAVATDSPRSETEAGDVAQDAMDSQTSETGDAFDSATTDSRASDTLVDADVAIEVAIDSSIDSSEATAASDTATGGDTANDSSLGDASSDSDAGSVTDTGSATDAAAETVIDLTAPLISSITEGQDLTGQIQVLGINYYIAAYGVYPSQGSGSNSSGSPYIAQVVPFASNFTPSGWLPCDGSLLSISSYEVLFNVIGTTYGGDGVTTFGVPDLTVHVPMGVSAAGSPANAPVPPGVSEVPLISSIALGQSEQGEVQALGLNYYIATEGDFPPQGGTTSPTGPYVGQIMSFAGNFAPAGWALCDGSLMAISQNTALFSIVGTMYGGNGTSNFALPDLRGRIALGAGTLAQFTAPPTSSTQIPTITTITLGGTAAGQVNALGIGYYVAAYGVFPSRDGTTASVNNLAEIMLFAGNFTPSGWLPCNGSLLPITQNTALFSLLGTMFGGNGTSNFGLPDLRARIPMGVGSD